MARKNRIEELRTAKGWSMAQLGEAAGGIDASTINKIEKGAMRLSDRWAEPIAAGLGVQPGDLFNKVDPKPLRTEVRPAPLDPPARTAMPNDVPVRGTAAGSHLRGAFQISDDAIDYVRRPPALNGARNAYALYVEGTSMVPVYNPGDLLFVHPDRPPRIGDSVVVQVQLREADGPEATIGYLRRRSASALVIGKLSPEAEVEINTRTIIAVHKVLTMNELFGV